MRILALGPLRLECNGIAVPLGTTKQRQVLALLLARANAAVSVDDLVDELWADKPPASAVANVRLYANNLSRLFAAQPRAPVLTRHGMAYVLTIDEESFDIFRFRRAALRGRELLGLGDPEAAVAEFDGGIALWRGRPADDVPSGSILAAWRTVLEDELLSALEDRAEALLRAGTHDRAISDASQVLASHPLRERAHALLIRARYQAGDVAGAMGAFDTARRHLDEQLGIEPGDELRRLYEAIRYRRATPSNPQRVESRPRTVIPRQLPPGVAGFAGRTDRLRQLDALLPHRGSSATAVVISAVSGTAGVGKTALAVYWAHRAAAHFPDGQLYVNLRGFDPTGSPMAPAEALRAFLDAFEVPPQHIPADVDAQSDLYRSLLADRTVLIVLDNARDAEQVRPLLPASPGCLTVITSRTELSSLVATDGTRPLSLDVLSEAEARELLTHRIGPARVAAEPDAVSEIIDRCARLPLALVIAAAHAVIRPDSPLTMLANELRESGAGLDAFADEDATTDVRAVLSWSYRLLSPGAARLFRLLGLHPGPDLTAAAAASLASLSAASTQELLVALTQAHMVTELTPNRYAFHDLLRAYAREQSDVHDSHATQREATQRILDHYLHSARAGALALQPNWDPILPAAPAPGVRPESFIDHGKAMTWFTAEHQVLLGCAKTAASTGFDSHVWQLALASATFLRRRGHWHDWAAAHEAGLDAARRAADDGAEARTHRGLARAYMWLDRQRDAEVHLKRALDLLHDLGDLVGQAHTHHNLSHLYQRQGRHREALRHCQKTLQLFQDADHRFGQALALNGIGWIYAHLGEYRNALEFCQRALVIHHELNDDHGKVATWDSLGYAYHHLGNHSEAIDCFRHSIEICQKIGDRDQEAEALDHLGDTYHADGNTNQALHSWQQAAKIYADLEHAGAGNVRTKIDKVTSA